MSVTASTSSRRHRAARGQGEALRGEILAAARDLLAETGNQDAVSVRAVAERVGVTTPSIYLHFKDKDDLLDAVCAEVFEALGVALGEAAALDGTPVERLMAAGPGLCAFRSGQAGTLPAGVHDLGGAEERRRRPERQLLHSAARYGPGMHRCRHLSRRSPGPCGSASTCGRPPMGWRHCSSTSRGSHGERSTKHVERALRVSVAGCSLADRLADVPLDELGQRLAALGREVAPAPR